MDAPPLLEANVWIDRAPEAVYRFVADFENYPEWFPGILQMKSQDDRPPGTVGKRYSEIAQVPPGREEQIDVELISATPNEELASQASLAPLRPRFRYRFVSQDGGCRFVWSVHTQESGLAAALARAVTRLVLRRRSRAAMANLKRILEREPAEAHRAAVQRRFGPPREVLRISGLAERPKAAPDEVLVRQRASSVNHIDLGRVQGYGRRYFKRSGINRFPMTVGQDVAGEVEDIGQDVSGFSAGDEVFGLKPPSSAGAHAEFVSVPAALVRPRPPRLGVVEAAAIPYVGVTAYVGLRSVFPDASTQGALTGRRFLIQGAAGGVGAAATRIAAFLGASVTGVVLDRQRDAVESLPMERVVTPDELAELPREYDLALQTAATGRRALAGLVREGGALITPVSPMLSLIDEFGFVRGAIKAKATLRRLKRELAASGVSYDWFFFEPDPAALDLLASLAGEGRAGVPIDSMFEFAELHEAYARQADPTLTGKVLLTFGPAS